MFQNFVSVPNTSTRYGGTGVGLGIVRSLVQLMGGSIRIIDKVTPGTLFRFDIRLERQQQEEVIEGPLPRAESACAVPDLVPLLGCREAGMRPRHVFAISHWDAAKVASIENDVSKTMIQMSRKVLLVMPRGKMHSKVAATWFERRGCHVTMESSWEGIRAAMEAISHHYIDQTEMRNDTDVARGNVDETDRKANKDIGFRCLVLIDSALIPEEQEESRPLRQLQSLRADMERIEKTLSLSTADLHTCCTLPCVSIALLVTAATHPSLQRAARSNGFTLLQKPLIPSRLTPLLTFFDLTRKPADRDRTIPLTSSQDTSEIAPAHSPHGTSAAEHSRKVIDCILNLLSREDDPEGGIEEDSQRALRKPDESTSPMLAQQTHVTGSVTGQREQTEYHTAATQSDQRVQKSLPPSGMTPLLTFSRGVGDSTARDMSTSPAFSQIDREHARWTQYAPDSNTDSCHSPGTSSQEAVMNDRVQSGQVYARALRDPEALTAPRLFQGTESVGRVTGQRQQLPRILTGVDVAAGSVRGGAESVAIDMENDRYKWKDSVNLQRESEEVSVSEDMRRDAKEDVKMVRGMVEVGVEGRRSDARERSLSEDKRGVPQNPHLKQEVDFKGLRILLVEDTPVMAQIATRQMEKIGAKVRWAQDGQVAVEIFTKIYGDRQRETDAGQSPESFPVTPRSLDDGFDVIVMDCQMPRLDGYGATAAIRDLEKVIGIHTPIVALTAHAMTTDRKKCLDAGMDEYLAKPLNLALFKATLTKLLKPKDS